ncbi:hypothetical protein EGM51_07770 [Verrucomicrobia bacterium S94]|nr:hypothetical protein EGM51_07770 [Verrucomicrobia bacterium S94]
MLRMQWRIFHHCNTIQKDLKRRKQIGSYIDFLTICFRNNMDQINVGRMRMNAHGLKYALAYSLLWIGYIAATFLLFPRFNISCILPVVPLIGLGVWFFGVTAGLWLTLFSLFHNFVLTGIVYANQITYYQYTLSGCILMIALSYFVGHLRTIQTELKIKHAELDHLVKLRSRQLDKLTSELLSESETFKNHFGQELHDSVGQQLTGIQLLSSSVTEQLLKERNRNAALSDRILSRAAKVHIQIRKISRMLFPVRISSTGLIPALNELSSTLKDIKKAELHIDCTSIDLTLQEDTALQLYRICQETTLHTIDHLNATHVEISIRKSTDCIRIRIAYNGNRSHPERTSPDIAQLIRYRLARIQGILLQADLNPAHALEFEVPLDPVYSEAAA